MLLIEKPPYKHVNYENCILQSLQLAQIDLTTTGTWDIIKRANNFQQFSHMLLDEVNSLDKITLAFSILKTMIEEHTENYYEPHQGVLNLIITCPILDEQFGVGHGNRLCGALEELLKLHDQDEADRDSVNEMILGAALGEAREAIEEFKLTEIQ
jgi:hypothetical protein